MENIDLEKAHMVEDLTARLHILEAEEKQLKEKMELIQAEKAQILKQIKSNSSDNLLSEKLAALYEQRRRK